MRPSSEPQPYKQRLTLRGWRPVRPPTPRRAETLCRLARGAAAVGWATLIAGVVVALTVQEHVDSCGQPIEGRPSGGAFVFAAVAALLGVVVTSTASWLRVRDSLPGGAALLVSGVVLACAGGVLAIGIFGSHFDICF